MQSENLGKLKEFVEEGDQLRFSYLEKVLGEIDIKFESKTDEICVFDEFEGSVLQEKLFLALIEVEEWPTDSTSYSLSARHGKGCRPFFWRIVAILSRRPVRILCG